MAKAMEKTTKKEETIKGTVTNYGAYPVRVAVFNKGDRNISIKIERSYKNKDGEYQSSSSLFLDDLTKLISVLQNIVNDYVVEKSDEKEFEIKK